MNFTMTQTTPTAPAFLPAPMIHMFEAAGLGKAPFKLDHIVSSGTHCQFCNTAIVYQFWLKGSDGKLFFVGSDCVMKTGDAGLIKVVQAEVKKHQRALRQKREAEKLAKVRDRIADPVVRAALSKVPHPYSYHARDGKTALDYIEYCARYAGKTTMLALNGTIDRYLAPQRTPLVEADEGETVVEPGVGETA